MKTRTPLLLIGLLAAAPASWAQPQPQTAPQSQGINYRDTVKITQVQVLTQRIKQTQQVCNQAPQAAPPAKHSAAGAVIGGVAGGLIGHTVGEGQGKTAATAGAAVVGAMVGNRLQNQTEQAQAQATASQPSCYLVESWVDQPSGAIVSYNWQGRTFTETLPYVPAFRAGDKVPLQVHATLGKQP